MEKKYDFKPKQWVLARYKNNEWILCQFSHITKEGYFMMCGGYTYPYCIPYKGNEHLRGTTDDYVAPYEPQNGDFVAIKVYEGIVKGANPWICIFKSISDAIDAYAGLGLDGDLVNKGNNVSYNKDWMKHIRPATEEERHQLLSKLHEKGKDWDAEKKEIVDWAWKPGYGEEYHSIVFSELRDDMFYIIRKVWKDTLGDHRSLKKGWVFRTAEEGQPLCKKLNEALKNVMR